MSILRVKHVNRYTCIGNDLINDCELSLKSLGLAVYLLSKPNDWSISVQNLANTRKEGKKSIYAAITELTELGYMTKEMIRDDAGQFKAYEYCLSETPSPQTQNRRAGYPLAEKETLLNTNNLLNNEKKQTKNIKKGKIDAFENEEHPEPVADAPEPPRKKIIKNKPEKPYQTDEFLEKFHKAYPKQARSPKQALKAALLSATLDDPSGQELLSILEAQKKERELCVKYGFFKPAWKYSARWIKDKRWTDEILSEDEIQRLANEDAQMRGRPVKEVISYIAPELRGL